MSSLIRIIIVYALLLSLPACTQSANKDNAASQSDAIKKDQYESKDLLATCSYASPNTYPKITVQPTTGKKVKNVILMIGDGMGLQHFYTAWSANRGQMNIENCMFTGLAKTYCNNRLITDSGAAGTAMATGQKTNYHAVGVDTLGNALSSLSALAHTNGLSTGVIVTCGLTDATPAAFCANNMDRDDEEELATDFLNCKVDYLFGGGRKKFNRRKDNRDLVAEMKKQDYQICTTWQEVKQVNQGKIFAVLEDGQLPLAEERGALFQDATRKGIELLSKNPKGFFAMVEGSRIDDCGHWNDLPKLVEEIFDFDKTVGDVLRWAEQDGETLVVILSDHETGALTLTSGNKETGEVTVHFANKDHSGVMVPVYAYGPQSNQFTGIMENTDIFKKIKTIMNW